MNLIMKKIIYHGFKVENLFNKKWRNRHFFLIKYNYIYLQPIKAQPSLLGSFNIVRIV